MLASNCEREDARVPEKEELDFLLLCRFIAKVVYMLLISQLIITAVSTLLHSVVTVQLSARVEKLMLSFERWMDSIPFISFGVGIISISAYLFISFCLSTWCHSCSFISPLGVSTKSNGDRVITSESRRKYMLASSSTKTLLTTNDLRSINKFVETAYVDCSKQTKKPVPPPSSQIPELPFQYITDRGDDILQMTLSPIHPKESALDTPLRFATPEEYHAPAFEDPPSNLPLSRRVAALLKGAESVPITWSNQPFRDRSIKEITVFKDADARAQAAIRSGDKTKAAKLYCLVGCLHYNYGNVELAIKGYTKALHLFEQVQNDRGIAYCHNLIGVSHFRLCEYKMALLHHKKQEALGGHYAKAVAQINLGVSYAAMGELEYAEQAFSDALGSAKASEDPMLETIAYGNLGLVSLRIGNMRGAQANLEQCLENCSAAGDKSGAAICLLLLGELYSLINDHQHALFYYEHAYRIGGEANNTDTVDIARVSIGIARGNASIRDAIIRQGILMGQEHDVETIVNMLPP
eukprot:gene4439-3238_t